METELQAHIDQWRGYVQRHRAISVADVDEMEDHLREQISTLQAGGLSGDEAFLVAVKRMGSMDAISREFALEHSERLWKQLVLVPEESEGGRRRKHYLITDSGRAALAERQAQWSVVAEALDQVWRSATSPVEKGWA